eukprot:1158485-Pelagomonas_calceolata.AAC.13
MPWCGVMQRTRTQLVSKRRACCGNLRGSCIPGYASAARPLNCSYAAMCNTLQGIHTAFVACGHSLGAVPVCLPVLSAEVGAIPVPLSLAAMPRRIQCPYPVASKQPHRPSVFQLQWQKQRQRRITAFSTGNPHQGSGPAFEVRTWCAPDGCFENTASKSIAHILKHCITAWSGPQGEAFK